MNFPKKTSLYLLSIAFLCFSHQFLCACKTEPAEINKSTIVENNAEQRDTVLPDTAKQQASTDTTAAQQYRVWNGFVSLREYAPEIALEIRYYTDYNFVGKRVDGYEQPEALMTIEAAKALKAANEELMKQGYRIKVYDAYRPQKAVNHFVRWAKDLKDTKMKKDFYPEKNKSVLFKEGYIASRSGHSRGSTVDLTIVHIDTGKDVDMGGTFDYFGTLSHPSYKNITKQQYDNRMLLRDAMIRHGFKPISTEWWHFTLKNEPYPNTYFPFPVKWPQE